MEKLNTLLKHDSLMLISDPPQDSACAMDRDLQLLEWYGSGTKSVVRFYSWKYPTISLGRTQNISVLDVEKVTKDGIFITSRPTGGRHIFHCGDFCFTLIIPQNSSINWGKTVQERQRTIGSILDDLMKSLNISVDVSNKKVEPSQIKSMQKLSCFSLAVDRESTVMHRKIAGVAQLITSAGGIIQGSIPLTSSFRDIINYEASSDVEREIRREVLEKSSCSLYELAPDSNITFEIVEKHFRKVLGAF